MDLNSDKEERKQVLEEEKKGEVELSIFERLIDDAGSESSRKSSQSASNAPLTLVEI